MVIHIAVSTGWTVGYVRNDIDIPAALALYRYWRKHPPIHLMIAGYFGIGQESSGESSGKKISLEELMTTMPPTQYTPPDLSRFDR